jgi:hypothetical protein
MSLCKEIILGEITGKNNAIHAYDKILWTIRSGYLTLMFGGWAIVIKGAMDQGGDLKKIRHLLIVMFVVSVSFAIGAFILDQNYERRKFRVIASLNRLLSQALNLEDVENIKAEERKALHESIQVAGDADNNSYRISGYKQAAAAGITLYVASVIAVLVAGLLFAFMT